MDIIITGNSGSSESSAEGGIDIDDLTMNSGYIVMGLMIFLPISLVCCGACYQMRFRGSDMPRFSSIFKGFANILDLYTDFAFAIYLFSEENYAMDLAISAIFFLVLSHIASNVLGIYYVLKWKKSGNIYISTYGLLIIILNIISMILYLI